jgi:hypothetical protein
MLFISLWEREDVISKEIRLKKNRADAHAIDTKLTLEILDQQRCVCTLSHNLMFGEKTCKKKKPKKNRA